MARAMAGRLQALVQEGVRLAVYPGLYGLSLAGPWPPDMPWQQIVRGHRHLVEAMRMVGSRAARTARVYLVPGSVLLPGAEGRLVEWTALFGPDGTLLGEQIATQPDPTLADKGLGRTIAPIDTPFGPVGLLAGADADVPDVARILTLQGARLLVAVRAPAAPYASMRAMAGMWQVVQQTQTFGLESGLVGMAAGAVRDGKAGIFAPGEMTPGDSGFLARPGYFVGHGAVTAALDLDALEAVRARRPLARHLNAALYRRNAPAFGVAPAGAARTEDASDV